VDDPKGEGWTYLVDGAIPGERVVAEVVDEDERSRRRFARVVDAARDVVAASPHRIQPLCRHASECGGCSWQHIAYDEQLRLKTRVVEELLRGAVGERAPRVAPMIGARTDEALRDESGRDRGPRGFRQKVSFVFGSDRGRLTMGHYARRSKRVIPIDECPVHSERGNAIAFRLAESLRRARIPAFDEAAQRPEGLARHALIRVSRDEREAAVVLVAADADRSLEKPLRDLSSAPGELRPEGVMLNIHPRPGPYLLGGETIRVDGRGHVLETVGGVRFLVSPTGFFQTNVRAADVLVRMVLDACASDRGQRVLDLYSGAGLFAIPLALAGHTVTAVEESRKATREAALNSRENDVPREALHLMPGKVEEAITHLARHRFDAVVLDPPREGCPERVLEMVVKRIRPSTLVLVSCNPESFASEYAQAAAAGYRAETVQPVDMFPHTAHIETVAVLRLGSRAPERERSPAPPRPRKDQPKGRRR
jgi:23S rRNA (uracil1939-C5)-methyltransferase